MNKVLLATVFVCYAFLASAQDGVLKFFVLGDWGGKRLHFTVKLLGQNTDPYTTEIQLQVAGQMGYIGESFQPAFIVGVGDNFYEYVQ